MNVVPGSEDHLSEQDRKIIEMTTGQKVAPYRYAGALEVGREFVKANLPQKPIDWVIFLATLPEEEVYGLARLAGYFGRQAGGAAIRLGLKEAPEAIRIAAEIEPEVADIIKAQKYIQIPEEVVNEVRESITHSEEKLLGHGSMPAPPGAQASVHPNSMLEGPETWEFGEGGPPRSPENKVLWDEEAQVIRDPKMPAKIPDRPYKWVSLANLAKAAKARPVRGAIAGGAYNALTGGNVLRGAEQGAIAGGVGVAGSAITNQLVGRLGPQMMVNSGIRQFGDALETDMPHLKGKMKTPEDLQSLYRQGVVQRYYGDRTKAMQTLISRRVAGHMFKVPLMEGGEAEMPFDAAYEYIRQLQERGYRTPGPVNLSPLGVRKYQMGASHALASMEQQLNELAPGLGDVYGQSRRQYGAAVSLTQMFRTEGVFGGPRGVDWPKVQGLLAGKYYKPLETQFGPERAQAIITGAYRGAPPVRTDEPQVPGHSEISVSLRPYWRRLGKPYKAVGTPSWGMGVPSNVAVMKYLNAYPSDVGDGAAVADPSMVGTGKE